MLLVNGCSHTAGDYKDDHNSFSKLDRSWASSLGKLLNQRTKNLSLGGASNKRIIRTTMEYLADHPNFDGTIIIAWTTHTRNEFTWVDSFWSKKPKGLLGGGKSGDTKKYGHWVIAANPHAGKDQSPYLKQFMELYYNHSHCYEFEREIFNQQLIMFESYLKNKGINYYFFCALDHIDLSGPYGKQLDRKRWIDFGKADNSCDFLETNGFQKAYCQHFDKTANKFLAEYIYKTITD